MIFERYEKISLSNECAEVIQYLQTLKKSRFDCSRRAFHLRSRKRYNSENVTLIEKDHLGDWSPEKDC